MNESRPHSNESDPKDMMVKKDLQELKITIYTNKIYFHFQWSNTPKLSVFSFEQLYVR